MRLTLFVLLLLFALSAPAQEAGTPKEDIPPPPTVIKGEEPVEPDEIEPTVTIITEGDQKIEEYRIRGRLYMIKVTPKNLPPYYIIDRDGDGLFETRESDLASKLEVPKWVITEW